MGLHQESKLSPLLLSIVMDDASQETMRGLLYADDLILMAESRTELQERVERKGLKVNRQITGNAVQ